LQCDFTFSQTNIQRDLELYQVLNSLHTTEKKRWLLLLSNGLKTGKGELYLGRQEPSFKWRTSLEYSSNSATTATTCDSPSKKEFSCKSRTGKKMENFV
jgi:hypothetical protein